MLIGKPEFTGHQTVGVLGLGQVGKHPLGIIVQRIHMIDGKLALHTRRILAHREIHTWLQLFSISPHLHLTAEGIDIQFEGLQRHLVNTRLLKLPLQILASLIGAVFGIAAPLILGAAQLLDHLFVLRQVLRTSHGGRKHQQHHCYRLFHTLFLCLKSMSVFAKDPLTVREDGCGTNNGRRDTGRSPFRSPPSRRR